MINFFSAFTPVAVIVTGCLFVLIGILKIIVKIRDNKARKAFEAAERERSSGTDSS